MGSSSVAAAWAAAAWQWQRCGGGGEFGGRGGSLSEAQFWQQRQHIQKHGGSTAALTETRRWQQQHDVGVGGGNGGSMVGSMTVAGEGRDVLATSYSQVMGAAWCGSGGGGEGCASHIIIPGHP